MLPNCPSDDNTRLASAFFFSGYSNFEDTFGHSRDNSVIFIHAIFAKAQLAAN